MKIIFASIIFLLIILFALGHLVMSFVKSSKIHQTNCDKAKFRAVMGTTFVTIVIVFSFVRPLFLTIRTKTLFFKSVLSSENGNLKCQIQKQSPRGAL